MTSPTDCLFINKLPVCWRGLFICLLQSKESTLSRMIDLYRDHISSKYGGHLDWNELLQCLSEKEPMDKDGSLIFISRFQQLPTFKQQMFLSFLHQKREYVSKSCLKSFINLTGSDLPEDTWLVVLYRMFKEYLQKRDEEQYNTDYGFLTENKSDAVTVRQKLANIENNLWSTATHVDHPEFTEPVTSSTNQEVGVMSLDTEDVLEEPLSKVQKLDPSQASQNQTTDLTSIQINPQYLHKMTKLKDKWESGDDIDDEMDVILQADADIVEALCNEVDLTDICENAVATACHQITLKGETISNSIVTILLSALLLNQFNNLHQSASRTIAGTISSVAEHFSRPLIDAVFVPTIKSSLNTFHADLIVKVCKDVFNNTSRNYFLQQIIKDQTDMTENLIAVLQTIIDTKLDIETDTLLTVLEALESHGNKFEKSLKYGKFILAVMNKYSELLGTEHKKILAQIMMMHKSFLKKSLQTTFAKL